MPSKKTAFQKFKRVCRCFQGARLGYAFKQGSHGVGYYLDEAQVGKGFVHAREQSFSEGSRSECLNANTRQAGVPHHEEIDIDVDDLSTQEKDIPGAVYGSLKGR